MKSIFNQILYNSCQTPRINIVIVRNVFDFLIKYQTHPNPLTQVMQIEYAEENLFRDHLNCKVEQYYTPVITSSRNGQNVPIISINP